MTQRFGKNQYISLIWGLGVGSIGMLPAYFALDLLVRYHGQFDHDASLLPFILTSSAVALFFFILGFWAYRKSSHIGLEVHVRPGQVEFNSTMFFHGSKNYIIKWNDVSEIVITDIPRAGETLYFHAHNIKEPWHRKGLPLKMNESWSATLLPIFKESAAEVGVELHHSNSLITFFYDRYLWKARKTIPK
jgi:hypothetical protein